MPYRRLPTTDKAILRALEAALAVGKTTIQQNLAYQYNSLLDLQTIHAEFSAAYVKLNRAKADQYSKSKSYNLLFNKARLFVSHFLQVLNMSIAREELKPEVRALFELEEGEKSLPSLLKEEEVLLWGQRVIDGEARRLSQGGIAQQNPSAAMLRVYVEQLDSAYRQRKKLQRQTEEAAAVVNGIRDKANEVVLQVWNQVEKKFEHLPEEKRRQEASRYGVVYIYRPSERKRLLAMKNQLKIEFPSDDE
ncbi:MAG: hypothetical protein ACK5LR_09615 [Mangrovibacterium sp.]